MATPVLEVVEVLKLASESEEGLYHDETFWGVGMYLEWDCLLELVDRRGQSSTLEQVKPELCDQTRLPVQNLLHTVHL